MSDEDQKFGLAGNEQAQGYEPMPMALPVEPTNALDVAEDLGTDNPAYKHLTRTDKSEPIDRSYKDVRSGEEIDPKYSVSAEKLPTISAMRDRPNVKPWRPNAIGNWTRLYAPTKPAGSHSRRRSKTSSPLPLMSRSLTPLR